MTEQTETSEESKDAETGDPTNPMLVYINKNELESGGISFVIAPGNMKVKCLKNNYNKYSYERQRILHRQQDRQGSGD